MHSCAMTGTHVAGGACLMIGLCVVEVRKGKIWPSPPWEWGFVMRFERVGTAACRSWAPSSWGRCGAVRIPGPAVGVQTPERYRL
jgi:hypothetical protein